MGSLHLSTNMDQDHRRKVVEFLAYNWCALVRGNEYLAEKQHGDCTLTDILEYEDLRFPQAWAYACVSLHLYRNCKAFHDVKQRV